MKKKQKPTISFVIGKKVIGKYLFTDFNEAVVKIMKKYKVKNLV